MEQASLVRQPSPEQHVPPAPPAQSLEPDVQAHLGRQLRAVYDELASQPVPDRFLKLLDALERSGSSAQGGGTEGPTVSGLDRSRAAASPGRVGGAEKAGGA